MKTAANSRRVMMRRPLPETVWKIWDSVTGGRSIALADFARAVSREKGCSRGTAYRAVTDALAEGVLERSGSAQHPR
jgi:hypothetical protein